MVFNGYSCFPFHPYISFFSLFFISKFCMSMIRVGYNICHERNTPHLPTAGWYRSAVPTVATCLPLTSQRTEVSYVNQSKLTFRKPFANSTTRFPDFPSMLPLCLLLSDWWCLERLFPSIWIQTLPEEGRREKKEQSPSQGLEFRSSSSSCCPKMYVKRQC